MRMGKWFIKQREHQEQINLHETMRNVMDFKMDQVRYVEAHNLIK